MYVKKYIAFYLLRVYNVDDNKIMRELLEIKRLYDEKENDSFTCFSSCGNYCT